MPLFDWLFVVESASRFIPSPVFVTASDSASELSSSDPAEKLPVIELPGPVSLSEALPLNPVSQLVDHLTQWSQEIGTTAVTPPPVRVVRGSVEKGEPLSLGQPCLALDPDHLPSEAMFDIQIQGQPIASLPERSQAEKLAHRLEQALQSPDFDPSLLHPAMSAGRAIGKAGETTLFTVEPDLTALFYTSADVIAIAWINRLRSALGARPLKLSTAQRSMYGLVTSSDTLTGTASWYGPDFHGRQTATGEIFDQTQLTAAHPSLPFDTYLEVTDQETGNSVVVRINDRGPYFEDRSLDLSQEAARCLNSETRGVVPYEAVVLRPLKAALTMAQRIAD